MWSVGCIMGEVISGKPLFPGTSTLNQVERIMAALPHPLQTGTFFYFSLKTQTVLHMYVYVSKFKLKEIILV